MNPNHAQIRNALRRQAEREVDLTAYAEQEAIALQAYNDPEWRAKYKKSLPHKKKKKLRESTDGEECIICSELVHYEPGKLVEEDDPFATTVEHKMPQRLGGTNAEENLLPGVCNACNRARGCVLSSYGHIPNWEPGDIRMYVRWLHIQLEDIYWSRVLFPQLHRRFVDEWKKLTSIDWTAGLEEYNQRYRELSLTIAISSARQLNGSIHPPQHVAMNGRRGGRRRPKGNCPDMSATARARRRQS